MYLLEHIVEKHKIGKNEKFSDRKFQKIEEEQPCQICKNAKKLIRYSF